MMLRLIVVVLACAMPIIATQQVTREALSVAGGARPFVLYVPDSARHEGPRPLVILLHGSGRDGRSLVDPWKDLARDEGIILARHQRRSVGLSEGTPAEPGSDIQTVSVVFSCAPPPAPRGYS